AASHRGNGPAGGGERSPGATAELVVSKGRKGTLHPRLLLAARAKTWRGTAALWLTTDRPDRAVEGRRVRAYRGDQRVMSTILVLDDDRIFRRLVVEALEQRGHRVLQAGRAAEADLLLEEEHADLLLVDGLLPDITAVQW